MRSQEPLPSLRSRLRRWLVRDRYPHADACHAFVTKRKRDEWIETLRQARQAFMAGDDVTLSTIHETEAQVDKQRQLHSDAMMALGKRGLRRYHELLREADETRMQELRAGAIAARATREAKAKIPHHGQEPSTLHRQASNMHPPNSRLRDVGREFVNGGKPKESA